MKVTVTLAGRFYHLNPLAPDVLELPTGATVDDALTVLRDRSTIGPIGTFGDSALVVVSGEHLGTLAAHQSQVLRESDDLFIFAPVAGG